MDVRVTEVFGWVILFAGQPNKAISVQEDAHRVDCSRHKYVDTEVKLVSLPQGWVFDVFLNYVGAFFNKLRWRRGTIELRIRARGGRAVRIVLCRVIVLFHAQILIEFFHLLPKTLVDLTAQVVQALRDKYTTTLGASLGLSYEKNFWVIHTLLESHNAALDLLLTKLSLSLPILLDVMEVAWV